MTLPWLILFGVALTVLAAATSVGMMTAPKHWRRMEVWAYGGARRPLPIWALVGLLLASSPDYSSGRGFGVAAVA